MIRAVLILHWAHWPKSKWCFSAALVNARGLAREIVAWESPRGKYQNKSKLIYKNVDFKWTNKNSQYFPSGLHSIQCFLTGKNGHVCKE